MEFYLVNFILSYFSVVYCNDIVLSLFYDNKVFLFKYFGVCLYYDSLFIEYVCMLFNFCVCVVLVSFFNYEFELYYEWIFFIKNKVVWCFISFDFLMFSFNLWFLFYKFVFFICMMKKVDEESNKNFFGISYLMSEYFNVFWELFSSLLMGYMYGFEYKEGWFCMLVSVMGLVFFGIFVYSFMNYIDFVSFGKKS